jgi:hypothetical protein
MINIDDNQTSIKTGDLPGKIPNQLSRSDVLCISSQVIRSLFKRVRIATFKETNNNATLSIVRALITAIKTYGSIMERDELAAMEKRIAELEKNCGEA